MQQYYLHVDMFLKRNYYRAYGFYFLKNRSINDGILDFDGVNNIDEDYFKRSYQHKNALKDYVAKDDSL